MITSCISTVFMTLLIIAIIFFNSIVWSLQLRGASNNNFDKSYSFFLLPVLLVQVLTAILQGPIVNGKEKNVSLDWNYKNTTSVSARRQILIP